MGAALKVHTPEWVPFHEDKIACVPAPEVGDTRVVLNVSCEAMSLDFATERRRLARHQWSSMVMMTVVAQDGRPREVATIPLRAVPMWLATIATTRIKDATIRAKIERYQFEAAEVLYQHFLGEKAVPADPTVFLDRFAPGDDARPAGTVILSPKLVDAARTIMDAVMGQAAAPLPVPKPARERPGKKAAGATASVMDVAPRPAKAPKGTATVALRDFYKLAKEHMKKREAQFNARLSLATRIEFRQMITALESSRDCRYLGGKATGEAVIHALVKWVVSIDPEARERFLSHWLQAAELSWGDPYSDPVC